MQSRSRIQTTGPNNGHQLRDYSKSSNRSESPLICSIWLLILIFYISLAISAYGEKVVKATINELPVSAAFIFDERGKMIGVTDQNGLLPPLERTANIQIARYAVFRESLYLHTDKPYYMAGDTIWFRAHLMNAENHQPACRSKFAYVELYDQKADTLMQRIMVKSDEDGVFANALVLPDNMSRGTYTLAAYTQWMRNFGAEHFFYMPLVVVNGQTQHLRVPSHLISGEPSIPRVEASISAEAKRHKSRMDIKVKLYSSESHSLSGLYSLSVTDADVVAPEIGRWSIRQYLSHTDSALSGSDNVPIVYPLQTEQMITGCVTGTLKKHLNNPHLLVLSHQEGWRREFELGDSSRFALAVDIPDGYSFTLEGTRHNGSTSLVKLSIDSLSYPRLQPPCYEQQVEIDLTGFAAQSVAQHAAYGNDGIELPEVVATGHKRPLSKRLGMPSFMLTAGDVKLNVVKDLEVLLRTMGVKHYVDAFGVPQLNVRILVISKDKGYVPISISDIPPAEIQQLDFYRGLKGEPDRVVMLIKEGARFRINKKNNMAIVRQLGYRPPVEFYSPQYPAADKSRYTRPDHRTTLYWNPKVRIDEKGETAVTFYASDVSKRYLVTIEGVSDDGIVVSKQVVIE